jgi:hypothetical protein
MLRRVASVRFGFSVQVDTLDEAEWIDIAAFIDKWLDAFTSEETKNCQRDQSRILKPT